MQDTNFTENASFVYATKNVERNSIANFDNRDSNHDMNSFIESDRFSKNDEASNIIVSHIEHNYTQSAPVTMLSPIPSFSDVVSNFGYNDMPSTSTSDFGQFNVNAQSLSAVDNDVPYITNNVDFDLPINMPFTSQEHKQLDLTSNQFDFNSFASEIPSQHYSNELIDNNFNETNTNLIPLTNVNFSSTVNTVSSHMDTSESNTPNENLLLTSGDVSNSNNMVPNQDNTDYGDPNSNYVLNNDPFMNTDNVSNLNDFQMENFPQDFLDWLASLD